RRACDGRGIGERHSGYAIGEAKPTRFERLRRAHKLDVIGGRPIGLDGEDALPQIRPRISHRPAEGPRLRVNEKDGWADLVEQSNERGGIELLLLGEISDRRNLARQQLLNGWVIEIAAARPLVVQMRLRPKVVFFLR